MNYIQYTFKIEPFSDDIKDVIIALLSENGFEGFVEKENEIEAYINENNDKNIIIDNILGLINTDIEINYTSKTIEQQNWNAIWESNYEPVFINKKVAVIAPFHSYPIDYEYVITISPKMSFGTGHHETTSLIITLMLDINFKDKKVLDVGCGTGILGILAEKFGSTIVTCIDNDINAVDNAKENVTKNNCKNIQVFKGDANSIPSMQYDIILSNITKDVLTKDIPKYCMHLINGGLLLLSGFFVDDLKSIEMICKNEGLILSDKIEKNNWLGCCFSML